MNDINESLPSSTSKHVFPQAQEIVFIRGQGEQAPLPNNKRDVNRRTKNIRALGRIHLEKLTFWQSVLCKHIANSVNWFGVDSTCGMVKGIYGSHI